MATRYLFVFCYDIRRGSVRAKVSAAMEQVAVRVQHSVFEAYMTPQHAETLFADVRGLIDPDDAVRVYAVGRHGEEHCMAAGGPPFPRRSGAYIL